MWLTIFGTDYSIILNEGLKYFGNRYYLAIALFVGLYIATKIFLFITKIVMHGITKKTKTDLDDKIFEIVRRPAAHFLTIMSLRIAIMPLELGDKIATIIGHVLDSAMILAVAYVLINIFEVLIDQWGHKWAKSTKSSVDDALLPLAHRFSKITLLILAVITILTVWGVNITGLVAGLGIAGLAIGLALQGTLSNVFGGISLILDKAVKVGDVVRLDNGPNRIKGEIADVGIRSTRIKTPDNELVIVPNSMMANVMIINDSQPDMRARVTIPFGVSYGTDHKRVKKIVLDAIKEVKNVAKDPKPVVNFESMGDFSLHFTAYLWVKDISLRIEGKEEAVCAIYDALNKAKINIPFPTQTLYLKK